MIDCATAAGWCELLAGHRERCGCGLGAEWPAEPASDMGQPCEGAKVWAAAVGEHVAACEEPKCPLRNESETPVALLPRPASKADRPSAEQRRADRRHNLASQQGWTGTYRNHFIGKD